MNILRAIVSLGLFGGIAWAVWTGQLSGAGGPSKSRSLITAVDAATERFGTDGTAIGVAAIGAVLAIVFLALHLRERVAG